MLGLRAACLGEASLSCSNGCNCKRFFGLVETARCTAIWSKKVTGKGTFKLSYKLQLKNNILMCESRDVRAGRCNSWVHYRTEVPDSWAVPKGKYICSAMQTEMAAPVRSQSRNWKPCGNTRVYANEAARAPEMFNDCCNVNEVLWHCAHFQSYLN